MEIGEQKEHKAKGTLLLRLRALRTKAAVWARQPEAPRVLVSAFIIIIILALVLASHPFKYRNGSFKTVSYEPCGSEHEHVKPFIYVYDFGGQYTDDVKRATTHFYSEAYDAERTFLEYVLGSRAVRTWDPEKALLFYVPFYAAYFLSSHFKDWENNMREAVMHTSEEWESLLFKVRSEFPYFNRTNGGDHFSVLSMDYGRCQNLAYVDPKLYGSMFFLTMAGDKMLRSTHTHVKRNMQILTYNYGTRTSSGIPDIPCYRSDLDIVVPPTLEESTRRPMRKSSPLKGERTITVLFRFRVEHHHKQPVLHSNHYIRKELYDLYRKKELPGWEFGVREPEKILREDMERSLFCICPPGHSQWTTRLAKAIIAGCIPITFFRDNDNPWQDELDYSTFSINVDPDALDTVYARVESVMRNPRRLMSMQRSLQKVQRFFAWDETDPYGAQSHVTRELWCRAKKIDKGPIGSMRWSAKAGLPRDLWKM